MISRQTKGETFLCKVINNIIIGYVGYHIGHSIRSKRGLRSWMRFSKTCQAQFDRFHPHLASDNWAIVAQRLQTCSQHRFHRQYRRLVFYATVYENEILLKFLESILSPFARDSLSSNYEWPKCMARIAKDPDAALQMPDVEFHLATPLFRQRFACLLIQCYFPLLIELIAQKRMFLIDVPKNIWYKSLTRCDAKFLFWMITQLSPLIEGSENTEEKERTREFVQHCIKMYPICSDSCGSRFVGKHKTRKMV